MFGLNSHPRKDLSKEDSVNQDVARVFFDAFSRRVGEVEAGLKLIASELATLRSLIDRGQISDLVLLDRLKRSEEFAVGSIASIRSSVEKFVAAASSEVKVTESAENTVTQDFASSISATPAESFNVRVPVQIGEIGSLPSITTATELQVLTLLSTEGPKSSPEIGRVVGRSREHTARLMKKLYEEGYIRRDQTRIPFRYSVVEKVKQRFEKIPIKNVEKGQISVPQT